MHLMRMIATHPIFRSQVERAAQYHQWYEFKNQMDDIGIEAKVMPSHPFAVVCRMKHDKRVKYPAIMLVMHVADSGSPWCANLNGISDYRRVGTFAMTWGFDSNATKQLIKDGFDVEESREAPPYR